jgi:multidrug efflux pump subunit AcrB
VIATGASHSPRRALGTAVFSGMVGVTVFGLLFTPAFYVVCQRFARRRRAPTPMPAPAGGSV